MAYYTQGDRFDQYTLETFLGNGLSAEVWQVHDLSGEVYALKIFAPSSGLDEFGRQQFITDYEHMAELHHPNILGALRGGTFDGKPFILMPLSESGSLMKVLRERMLLARQQQVDGLPFFTEEELASLILQVADALIYLRHNGIIHMDVKPDNVLIMLNRGRQQYVLTDFGISIRVRRTILKQTRQRISADAGMTPAYAAPEVYKGEISSKSDVFSLGAMVFELACGETPSVPSGVGIGMAMLNGAATPLLEGDFSDRFRQLLADCMAFHPEDRCNAEDLRRWARHFVTKGGWPSIVKQPGVPAISQSLDIRDTQPDESGFLRESSGEVPLLRPAPQPVRRRKYGVVALGLVLLSLLGWWSYNQYHLRQWVKSAQTYWQAGDLRGAAEHYSKLCARFPNPEYCQMAQGVQGLQSKYTEMSAFTNGLARVGKPLVMESRDTIFLYGYVSSDTRVVIPARYVDGGGFNTFGLAAVAENHEGKKFYGMINRNGDVRIPFRYQQLIVRPDQAIGDLQDTFYFKLLDQPIK